MKNNMNICVVAGTHGDEFPLGAMVLNRVNCEVPGDIYGLTGNPRAVEADVRFVDSDLNRGFNGNASGYEAERAAQITEIFAREGFTHVIDIHTSPTTHSIVPIVPGECASLATKEVINSIPESRSVVNLPKAEPPTSLVGAFGAGGVGLECPRHNLRMTADSIASGLIRLARGRGHPAIPRHIFKMFGSIPASHALDGDIDDFEEIPGLPGLSFVAAPSIYKALDYASQGMLVKYDGERRI